MSPVTRRAVLLGGAGMLGTGVVGAGVLGAAGPGVPTPSGGAPSRAGAARTALARGEPFTLGVASGEPAPDGAVLWTRLARNPLAADGLGGMGSRPVEVEWEVADDERFATVRRRGRAVAAPQDGFTVHAEVTGLPPGGRFHYRFRSGNALSPAGVVRTAPAPGAASALTMCFASCAEYEHGWFTAYRAIAHDEPDLVLFLGDYLYETAGGEYVADSGNVRTYAGGECVSLADYRRRYAEHHSDPDLQAAHAAAPWLPVFDDHEVENNWADEVPEEPDPRFPARRAAALQAYWENMPLRAAQRPTGPDMRLYRRVPWGSLVTFHMLDTRQYRDDQACGDEFASDCPARTAPGRTITGADQERWLADGLCTSPARWNVLGQQVFFSQLDFDEGPGRGFNPDAWDGYAVQRDRVVDSWVGARVRNPVVLTGDVHSHYGADIQQRAGDTSSPVVGTELVTSSITTRGDATETEERITSARDENPHIRFGSDRRGYVRTRWSAERLEVDFRVLDAVSVPDARVSTAASFTVEDGHPGLESR